MTTPEVNITPEDLFDVFSDSKLGPNALTRYANMRQRHQLDHQTAKGLVEFGVTDRAIAWALSVDLTHSQILDLRRRGKRIGNIATLMEKGASLKEATEAGVLEEHLMHHYETLRTTIGHEHIMTISRLIKEAGLSSGGRLNHQIGGNNVLAFIFDEGLSPERAVEATLSRLRIDDYRRAIAAGISYEELMQAWKACRVRRRLWIYIDSRERQLSHEGALGHAERARC